MIETEGKRGVSLIFIDRPNIRYSEINVLKKKIDYLKLIQFLSNEDEKLIVFLYYTAAEEEGASFKQFLKGLRDNLRALGIDFMPVELNRDIDLTMINDIWCKVFEGFLNGSLPKKITLFSGDYCFGPPLGTATRLGIETTVIAEEESCAEILKEISTETIFLSDLLEEHPELVLKDLNQDV